MVSNWSMDKAGVDQQRKIGSILVQEQLSSDCSYTYKFRRGGMKAAFPGRLPLLLTRIRFILEPKDSSNCMGKGERSGSFQSGHGPLRP
jgi:hypothetical protein